ncbi:NAD(P)H-dependent flavin oxidoreductase [Georgenia yuyongxinii]|uniref:Nitronate monooxygenase n=1 Tax=Georgenia yuyongxinii TaxID=2589797 RepID=A0A552WUZ8_9MICO|nr:nitronate monooxygenase [Georgenia yuyongxinii]TRW46143.1 nitronate monooxygenase [Georgenia yuyongxinii]
MRTWLTDAFALDVPVVCAPMAGPGEGPLAAAVSAAGGLGMIGVGAAQTPDWVERHAATARATGRSFGIGLMAWVLDGRPDLLDAAIAARPALVSVSFGTFEPHVRRVKDAGIAVATQAGNLDEARRAEQAGVDLVVARGAEAGGHGRADIGTLPLLQTVLEHVQVPVLAAGGIAGPRGLAAVLAAGAAGAWVGTAFLGCPEATATPDARRALFAATDTATAYGRVFDVGSRVPWPPEFGGRALRNAYLDTWEGRLDELADDEEAAEQLARARAAHDYDVAYLYAGQGVGVLREERPAAAVLADFARAAPARHRS